MILLGIVVGLAVGLALGGRLESLVNVRLRFALLIVVAVFARFGTQIALERGVTVADTLRLPLFATAFAVLATALWLNRRHAGLALAAAGVAMNGIAMTLNGGFMPVYDGALAEAGLTAADLSPSFHVLLPMDVDLSLLLRGGPLGDILPFPVPFLRNVVSLGDVAISIGLGLFVFGTLMRGDVHPVPGGMAMWGAGERPPPQVSIDRPMMLGGSRGGGRGAGRGIGVATVSASSAAATLPMAGTHATDLSLPLEGRIRDHPYVRLALDARFSAFWLGQTISLFGDRLHQVALGVLVLNVTGSPLATGLVFMAATLPNLILGPVAGTFVDRWDHKSVMVASDVIRAGLVLAVPAAAAYDIALVYPLVFAITAVSLFFRPAKTAVVPRLVRRPSDLLAANSATWTGETMADILGYPLAGLFVALLGTELALAFWVDGASYLISALLIGGIVIPPVIHDASARVGGALRSFMAELRDGWHVLRGEPRLFQNTLISTVSQLSVGTLIALAVVYARDGLDGRFISYPASFAALETAIGVGNLIGGVAVGIVGARLGKGRMVLAGFAVMGLATVILGLTSNVLIALLAAGLGGIANLVYIIPSQTLFAELTPAGYMGRVVALRSTLVFGAMTGSMAASAALAEVVPVGVVLAASGMITVVAAGVGWFLPQVRDA